MWIFVALGDRLHLATIAMVALAVCGVMDHYIDFLYLISSEVIAKPSSAELSGDFVV